MTDDDSLRRHAIWRVLAVIGLAATVVMSLLWWGARNDTTSDASDAPPELIAELDAVRDDLTEARRSLSGADAEIAALEEAAAAEPSGDTQTTDELAGLREENERLREENAALIADDEATEAENDESNEATTTTTTVPDTTTTTTVPDTTTTTTVSDVTTTTVPTESAAPARTALETGTLLGNLYRDNVLGEGQRTCIGEFASDQLGPDLDVILAGDDPGADDRLVETLLDAAPNCGIDLSAIFG